VSCIFISHVEENACIALEIALYLEEAGYATWCYEIDSVSGTSYVKQVIEEIGKCQAFLVIVSPQSVSSVQVDREMNSAFRGEKRLVPVQYDITYDEAMSHRPEWLYYLGSTASVTIPPEGVEGLVPLILDGLKSMNVNPMTEPNATRINLIRKKLSNLQKPGAKSTFGIEIGIKDQIDAVNSLNKLAELYIKQKNYSKAIPLLNKTLVIQERVMGPDHPDLVKSLVDLAEIYMNQKKYTKALPLLKRAIDISNKSLGPMHPIAKQIENNIRVCQDKMS